MVDQNTFLETLREVAEIARTSEEDLSEEEIHRYFAGMELTAEQEEMVSQYLKNSLEGTGSVQADADNTQGREGKAEAGSPESQEEITEAGSPDGACQGAGADTENADEECGNDTSLDQLSDSAYYRMYLNEVREKGSCSEEQLRELYRKLIEGGDVSGQIADGWLIRIIRMAEFYKESPVNMQDLIQEGNIALWMALSDLPKTLAASEIDSYLEGRVRNAFEEHIRAEAGDADRTQAVLAKAGLLHEAQEVLAKENGQVPSLRELSEYTHVPAEEIQSVLALYEQQGN